MAKHTFNGTAGLKPGESPMDIARALGLPLGNPHFTINHGPWGIDFDFGMELTDLQEEALQSMAAARGWGSPES